MYIGYAFNFCKRKFFLHNSCRKDEVLYLVNVVGFLQHQCYFPIYGKKKKRHNMK